MADDENTETVPLNQQNKNSRKRKSDIQIGIENQNDDVIDCLQEISKCFGVGGLYSTKKRKIETHKETLPMLNEEWFNLDLIKNLSKEGKKRYAEEMSPIAIKNLMNLRKLIAFSNQAGNKSRDKKQKKDLAMDYLLKGIKANPSLPIPERYCEMGLWRQIMKVNQHVWRVMESLEEQEEGSNEKDEIKKVIQENKDSGEKSQKSFRDFYMEMVTSNFSDDLDKLRQDPSMEHKKLSILIDCLETGKDIWSDVEKELLQSLETGSVITENSEPGSQST